MMNQVQLEYSKKCFHKASPIYSSHPVYTSISYKAEHYAYYLYYNRVLFNLHVYKTKINLVYSQYLKNKMMAICLGTQNWGFDPHVYRKKWWCLNINLLEIFLLFWKVINFQELSCHLERWNVRTESGS